MTPTGKQAIWDRAHARLLERNPELSTAPERPLIGYTDYSVSRRISRHAEVAERQTR
jgi:hypothetical protein